MRTFKTISKTLVSAALATSVLAITPAVADSNEDAIKARQGFYSMISANFGGLVAMAKGEVDYDAKMAKTYADNLEALTKLNTGIYWIPGTDNEAYAGKTRAKPELWAADSKAFEYGGALGGAIAELAGVAGDGLDALRPMIGKVGGTCQQCHKAYRARSF